MDAFFSFIEKDLKEHPLKSNNAFKNLYLKCIDRIYNQGTIANTPDANFFVIVKNILKKIKDSINADYAVCNNIHNIFNINIVGDIASIKNKENASVSAIILAFILYLICKDAQDIATESDFKQFIKTIPSLQKKYLIIFDNLEVFDNGSLQEIAVVIKKASLLIHEMLLKLDNLSKLSDYFYRNYICVCAMRTSTFNLVYEALHDGSSTLGHFYEHLELDYNNIFQEAILKKIRFLYYLGLQDSPFVKKLESVTKFLFNKSTRDKLNSKQGIVTDLHIDTALKIYIENNFVAFFNNDIRRATNSIINIFNQNKNATKIRELLNSRTTEDLNGARQAIFRGLFDEISEHTLAQFGFEPIDPKHGCEKCSATRILLAYLKWNELYENNQLSLQKALEHIRELHLYTPDQIADWIYTISNVVAKTNDNSKVVKDYEHYELISQKWSSLIAFSENLTREELKNGIKQYFLMPNKPVTINGHSINNIKIHLTPAGQSVIYNVASQYEFFASRIDSQYKPLYCYDDIKVVL